MLPEKTVEEIMADPNLIANLIPQFKDYLTRDVAARKLLEKGLHNVRYFIRALSPEGYNLMSDNLLQALYQLLLKEKKQTPEQLLKDSKFADFIKYIQNKSAFKPWDEDYETVATWYEKYLRDNFQKTKEVISKIFPNLDWKGFDEMVEATIKDSIEQMRKSKDFYLEVKKLWTDSSATASTTTAEPTGARESPEHRLGYGVIPYTEGGESYFKSEEISKLISEPTPPPMTIYSLTTPEGLKWSALEGTEQPIQTSPSYVWKGFPTIEPSAEYLKFLKQMKE